ncbi:nuclease-related domain-containing protein [Sporolactobacillus pectinivorans]|uniref:nuclease-related domain-containing protein n=1 Tax=Sporolactobacillus pectinivorans TaxID=1591408 RepID=UPI000C262E4A|nr:nuclease-related domain-containing protein [Sporolactobacillus pectinivorans]
MILKKLKIPYHVLQLESVVPRLRHGPTHEKLSEKLRRYQSGFNGEKSVCYPLSFLPQDDYHLIHDLRLCDGTHHFQMDWLIIHTNFITLLEIKNLAGMITLDTRLNQMKRELNGKTELFNDPLVQAENLKDLLNIWIRQHNLCSIPIYEFVVFSSPHAYVQTTSHDDPALRKIVKPANLKRTITALPQVDSRHSLTKEKLLTLGHDMVSSHQTRKPNLFQSENLSVDDIMPGVRCPNCGRLQMKKVEASWFCSSCKTLSKHAGITALRDYYLINGPKITNQQCRNFLLMDSASSAKHLLQSLNLKYKGDNRGRVYFLSFTDLD